MTNPRYNLYRSTVHWRYATARPRLTFFDARLVFFVAPSPSIFAGGRSCS